MKKIALLSNITINMIEKELRQNYLIYIPNGYDTWISEIFNKTSSLFSFLPEAIVVLLDGTEFNGYVDINKVKEKLLLYQNALNNLIHSFENIPIFISTIDFRESKIKSYYERKTYFSLSEYWYDSIQKIVEENKNVYVLDIFDKIIEIGRTNFYSNKMWYLGNMPYSKIGIYTVVNEINNALSSAFSSRKKIIVLDLDNTLWGGVIGEDGLDGIELSRHKEGARYYDFQMCFQEMKKRGVLLAISSKNNLNDVEEVFEKHPDIALKKDDFVSMKINWNNKADNIKSIEAELNLTEGSFVFIDDNPIEREIVKNNCTEITVLDFPVDTTNLIQFANKTYEEYFKPLVVTKEDTKKTEMYHVESKRNNLRNETLNLDEYIQLLEIKADIHFMFDNELERVHQLCNKTNQFNLTTKRYTLKELVELKNSNDVDLFTISSSDKFGVDGVVGFIVCKKKKDNIDIDTFLLSCRVMGRKLEYVVISSLCYYYKNVAKTISGKYIKTSKNTPVSNLYDELGFKLIKSSNEEKDYIYELCNGYSVVKSYLEIRLNGKLL